MEKHYMLLDKDSSKISPFWKGFHIFSLTVVIISGFTTAYALGKSIEGFGNNCILNAHIQFYENHNSTKPDYYRRNNLPLHLKPIDATKTLWGDIETCYVCQFSPATSMIFGIIWCTFFILCSKGGAGFITAETYQPWRIVYPAMIFAAIASCIMLLSTSKLSTGLKMFCAQFENVFNTKQCLNEIDQYTLSFHDQQKPIILFLKLAIISSYVCFIGWLFQLISLILRVICITDFQMIRISVLRTDDTEKVLNIIDPSDSNTFIEHYSLPHTRNVEDKEEVLSTDEIIPHENKKKRGFLSFLKRSRKTKDAKLTDPSPTVNVMLRPGILKGTKMESTQLPADTSKLLNEADQRHPLLSFADESPIIDERTHKTLVDDIPLPALNQEYATRNGGQNSSGIVNYNVKETPLVAPRAIFENM